MVLIVINQVVTRPSSLRKRRALPLHQLFLFYILEQPPLTCLDTASPAIIRSPTHARGKASVRRSSTSGGKRCRIPHHGISPSHLRC